MNFDYTAFDGFQNLSADRSQLVDSVNRMRTSSLFAETTKTPDMAPWYSLKDVNNNTGLPSAYLIYMSSVDEYDAATKLVGSLRHWRKLCSSKWFMEGLKSKGFEGLDQWREDMKARDASQGKAALMKQVKKGDTSAARKIVDMAKPTEAPKIGRPGTKAAKAASESDKRKAERQAKVKKLREQHEAKHGA